MRKFNITVNGNSYEVEVEEIGGVMSAPMAPQAPVAAPAAPAAPAPQAAPAPKQEAPKQAPSGAPGSITVSAPMPGTIMDIKVNVGDMVEEGQAVVVLEAMKMENDIAAPSSGKVASINVSKGDSVNSGDVIITLS